MDSITKMNYGLGLAVGAMLAVLASVSGCSGIEVGGSLGVYRVDEREESSRMTRHNAVPLKCYFVQCEQETLDLK